MYSIYFCLFTWGGDCGEPESLEPALWWPLEGVVGLGDRSLIALDGVIDLRGVYTLQYFLFTLYVA